MIVENQLPAAEALLDRLMAIAPGRLYVELQRHGRPEEARAEGPLVDWAYAKGLPIVATNEPMFAKPDMFEAHDALLCVAGNTVVSQADRRRITGEHYFKGGAEMSALFADLPEAIATTLEVARRISYRPKTLKKPILPRFKVGEGETEAEALSKAAHEGLTGALEESPPVGTKPNISQRLEYRARCYREDGFLRLLLDRCRLYRLGESA